MKTKSTILLLLLLSLISQNILAFKPVGGYMNFEKIADSAYQVRFETIIFFEEEIFPDSVLYDFGDELSEFVRLKNAELLCNGLWKCNYETMHTYPYDLYYVVNVSIDCNTFFSGNNVLKPTSPFNILTAVSWNIFATIANKVNLSQNIGLIHFHKDLRFSVSLNSDFVTGWKYFLSSRYAQIPENSISINSETGDVLIRQLPDTGNFLFTLEVEDSLEQYSHFIHISINNRASSNPISYENTLQKDGHGIFYSKTNPRDSLKQTMYFNDPNADSIAVDILSNIPWSKNPVIETSRLNDSFKIASLFFMDEESYKVLPLKVLYKIKAFKGGVCTEYFSSFYFAPKNYTPTGIEMVKQTQLQNILLPNPTTGILQLNAELAVNEDTEIEIFDVTGKKKAFKQTNNQLNISDFTPGIYFVWIKENGRYIHHQKIVKQ